MSIDVPQYGRLLDSLKNERTWFVLFFVGIGSLLLTNWWGAATVKINMLSLLILLLIGLPALIWAARHAQQNEETLSHYLSPRFRVAAFSVMVAAISSLLGWNLLVAANYRIGLGGPKTNLATLSLHTFKTGKGTSYAVHIQWSGGRTHKMRIPRSDYEALGCASEGKVTSVRGLLGFEVVTHIEPTEQRC